MYYVRASLYHFKLYILVLVWATPIQVDWVSYQKSIKIVWLWHQFGNVKLLPQTISGNVWGPLCKYPKYNSSKNVGQSNGLILHINYIAVTPWKMHMDIIFMRSSIRKRTNEWSEQVSFLTCLVQSTFHDVIYIFYWYLYFFSAWLQRSKSKQNDVRSVSDSRLKSGNIRN